MNNGDLLSFHRKLLNDDVRMRAYRAAIQAVVRPGDVVLDIGGGSGILALFACQAGAAKVYCVELSDMIRVAEQLAIANNLDDRIVFLQADAMHVELPEKVDVIQSELVSKGVLGQCMAEIIGTCRDRFLKPGGRILPARVDLVIAPVECAEAREKTLLPGVDAYHIDFSVLAKLSENCFTATRIPQESLLADGQLAYTYEASTAAHTDSFDARLRFSFKRPGRVDGYCAWFEATLAPGIHLDNRPPGIGSWDNLFFPLPSPVSVSPATALELRFRGRDDSKMPLLWAWETTLHEDGRAPVQFSQSTLQSRIPPSRVQPDLAES
jgi:SAM-dependent methyltransferase